MCASVWGTHAVSQASGAAGWVFVSLFVRRSRGSTGRRGRQTPGVVTFKGSPFSSLSLSAYSKTRGRKEEAPSLLSLSPLLTLPGACHTQTAYTARILVRPRRTEDGLEEEGKRRRRRKEALSLSSHPCVVAVDVGRSVVRPPSPSLSQKKSLLSRSSTLSHSLDLSLSLSSFPLCLQIGTGEMEGGREE